MKTTLTILFTSILISFNLLCQTDSDLVIHYPFNGSLMNEAQDAFHLQDTSNFSTDTTGANDEPNTAIFTESRSHRVFNSNEICLTGSSLTIAVVFNSSFRNANSEPGHGFFRDRFIVETPFFDTFGSGEYENYVRFSFTPDSQFGCDVDFIFRTLTIEPNQWSYLIIELTPDVITCYLNGASESQSIPTFGHIDFCNTSRMCFRDNVLSGYIDDYKLYSRRLSESEKSNFLNGSTVTGVTSITEESAIKIQNPVSTTLKLPNEVKDFKVFSSASGKEYDLVLTNGKIDITPLPSGSYFIKLELEETTTTTSFIKN